MNWTWAVWTNYRVSGEKYYRRILLNHGFDSQEQARKWLDDNEDKCIVGKVYEVTYVSMKTINDDEQV